MKLTVTALHVYPVKSLAGISLNKAKLSTRGFEYDRHWMLVDPKGVFITQRSTPELVFFKVAFVAKGIEISHPQASTPLFLAFEEAEGLRQLSVQVWDDYVDAVLEPPAVSQWFSAILGKEIHLARFSNKSDRPIAKHEASQVGFADSNQYMIVGESALEALNERLENPVPMNRFRPNIVFAGGAPHTEDDWKNIQINEHSFEAIKLCSRCQIITIDQNTAVKAKEPTATLAKYRVIHNKVMFGLHLKLASEAIGEISVGDEITTRR